MHQRLVTGRNLRDGLVTVSNPNSTIAITTDTRFDASEYNEGEDIENDEAWSVTNTEDIDSKDVLDDADLCVEGNVMIEIEGSDENSNDEEGSGDDGGEEDSDEEVEENE
ncbi:hypothetical protein PTNB73_00421 [Pyrenophora teres f. teres]|nr:hypothetical protein HRS9139_01663 [Pyrenophora teres f. teres]KAE8851404.1 hypothetical protein HRS9122_01691 [Pyrenophora teres f. teres]KAE8873789.1 hypothetical protein PTNB73_00421 [Pyrenophora teres f. teres]